MYLHMPTQVGDLSPSLVWSTSSQPFPFLSN